MYPWFRTADSVKIGRAVPEVRLWSSDFADYVGGGEFVLQPFGLHHNQSAQRSLIFPSLPLRRVCICVVYLL
jgi:hypothetical protein